MATQLDTTLPETPDSFLGSRPEYLVYWSLLKLGYKNRFEFQSSQFGGRLYKGGAILDFYVPELNLAINVQGSYYHYRTLEQRTRTQLQRAQLEGAGIQVVYIDEEDLLQNPLYFVKEALSGIDHSTMMKI